MPKKVLRSKQGKMLKPHKEESEKPWTDECQFNVHKDVEADKRVKPKDVFEGYKDPKKDKKDTRKNKKK
jgi:hypothetical protein